MRQSLVAGNWKLNGTRSSVVELANSVVSGVAALSTNLAAEVLICPSFVHLSDVQGVLAGSGSPGSALMLGAQDCCAENEGAFTGEVSAAMLGEFGCQYVIVGHSERRQLFSETNESVAAKFLAVQKHGLTPILCVGETLEEREAGDMQSVIAGQLDAVLLAPGSGGASVLSNAVIAYEPVWAIGTGKSATAAEAQDVHDWLRKRIAADDAAVAGDLRILYGGSVKPGNAAELFAQADIDGGLIGGAALSAQDFVAICEAA